MITNYLIRGGLVIALCVLSFIGYKFIIYQKLFASSVGNIEYEDSYVNAKAFRDEFRKVKKVDSMFAKDARERKFMFERVKILRNSNEHLEAIAIATKPSIGNYYLIVDDSIFQMSPIRKYRQ